ncbi:MAG: cupin domain-containing protein [Candidatus Nezhaarchaeales archaeon]
MVVMIEHSEKEWEKMNDKVRRKVFYAGNLMFVIYDMDPGAEVPLHSHPEEQAGFIVQGEVEVYTDKDRKVLKAGSWYYFASNEPHGGKIVGPQRALVVDVFTPPRKDFMK